MIIPFRVFIFIFILATFHFSSQITIDYEEIDMEDFYYGVGTRSGSVLFVGGGGFGNFSLIQDAIDNVTDGDVIRIFDGTYIENLIISNPLTLLGNGSTKSIVKGVGGKTVIDISCGNVKIKNINITTEEGSSASETGIKSESDEIEIDECSFYNFPERAVSFSGKDEMFNNTSIKNCRFTNNKIGIILTYLKGILISDCEIYNGDIGIYLTTTENCIIRNSTMLNCDDYCVYISGSKHCEVKNINGSYSANGIYISLACESNTITNSMFIQNDDGIQIAGPSGHSSMFNIIKNNEFYGNKNGIHLSGVFQQSTNQNNSVIDNYFKDNKIGIKVQYNYLHTEIFGNTIIDSEDGILLFGTRNISIDSNNLTNCGIRLFSHQLGDWSSNFISSSNIVNGFPVVSLRSQSDQIIEDTAGQVFLFDCKNIQVKNIVFDKCGVGVLLVSSTNVQINNVRISNCYYGQILVESDNNVIWDCLFKNNRNGISLRYSDDNEIKTNTFFEDTSFSLTMIESNKNSAYLNNFFSETVKELGFSEGLNNVWNSAEFGNYWSFWTIPDNNVDGIVDDPYPIPESPDVFDELPLTEPYGLLSPPINRTPYEDILYSEKIGLIPLDEDDQVVLTSNASWLNSSNNEQLLGTPTNVDVGEFWVFVSLMGSYYNCSINFSLNVINTNDPPQFDIPYSNFSMSEDTVDNHINLTRWFKDIDGDVLTYTIHSQNITTSINSNSMVMVIPNPNWNGKETILVYANDSKLEVSDNITITVLPINDQPINNDYSYVVDEKNKNLIHFTANSGIDFDNDPLVYNWVFGDGEIESGQEVDHTFPTLSIGMNYTVSLTISDGIVDSLDAVKTIFIPANKTPPIIDDDDALEDSDHDSIPDKWEMYYFGNLTQSSEGDFDGDGISNLEEYKSKFNPKEPDDSVDDSNRFVEFIKDFWFIFVITFIVLLIIIMTVVVILIRISKSKSRSRKHRRRKYGDDYDDYYEDDYRPNRRDRRRRNRDRDYDDFDRPRRSSRRQRERFEDDDHDDDYDRRSEKRRRRRNDDYNKQRSSSSRRRRRRDDDFYDDDYDNDYEDRDRQSRSRNRDDDFEDDGWDDQDEDYDDGPKRRSPRYDEDYKEPRRSSKQSRNRYQEDDFDDDDYGYDYDDYKEPGVSSTRQRRHKDDFTFFDDEYGDSRYRDRQDDYDDDYYNDYEDDLEEPYESSSRKRRNREVDDFDDDDYEEDWDDDDWE